MVLGIFVGGIFVGFSLGLAAMALVSARNYRLQCQEVRDKIYPLAGGYTYINRFNRSLRTRPSPAKAPNWITPGL